MATVRLPRAIDRAGAARLLDDIRRAAHDLPHDVIVLTGDTGVFCEGLDLDALGSAAGQDDDVTAAVEAVAECLTLLHRSPRPTIALVNGAARGGGVGMAAACDVVIASSRSSFALPELLWGLLPAMIYPSLRERLSVHRCRLWALTGGTWTADDALRAGLVDEVVPVEALERASREWQRRLSRTRPESVARLRRFVDDEGVRDYSEATRRGAALTAAALLDGELRARLQRFAETGQPPWETT